MSSLLIESLSGVWVKEFLRIKSPSIPDIFIGKIYYDSK